MALVEIHREDIPSLPRLLTLLRASARRFVLYCDDLSFEGEDASYKSLKAVLEGGIEGRPANVVFYATSNRRHLLSRDMIENERSTAINPAEATEEKVSLSDRFGLWLGFHNIDQDTYFAIIEGYAAAAKLAVPARSCTRRRWNGRSRADPAQAASPINSSRILPDGLGRRWAEFVRQHGLRIDGLGALTQLEVKLRLADATRIP